MTIFYKYKELAWNVILVKLMEFVTNSLTFMGYRHVLYFGMYD